MILSYNKFLRLQKLFLILVSGYLRAMPTDHQGLSQESPGEWIGGISSLESIRCSFCDKSLLTFLQKIDKSFLDNKNNQEEVILSSEFYKAALVKHTAENGKSTLLHPLCALKKRNILSTIAIPTLDVKYIQLSFVAGCTSYENFDIAKTVFNLSLVTEDSSLVFRYISSLLKEVEENYFSCLCRADPGIDNAMKARDNIMHSSFENKTFYLAYIDLYICSKQENADPIQLLSAVISYLKTSSKMDENADEILIKYWALLASRLNNAEEVLICLNEITDAIPSAKQGKFTKIYQEMLTSYSDFCTNEEFSSFIVDSIISSRGFTFDSDACYAQISTKLPSFESFLSTLDSRLNNLESIKKIVLTESYLKIGRFIYSWYNQDSLLLEGQGLTILLVKFFAFKKDEIENKRICPTSEGFFSAYKTVFMDQSIAIQSFVYDHIIKSLFELLAIKDMETTLKYLNFILQKEQEMCTEQYFYGFMAAILKEFTVSKNFREEIFNRLEKAQKLDVAVMIVRQVSCEKVILMPLSSCQFLIDKLVFEKFFEKDYAIRYNALKWLDFMVSLCGNNEGREYIAEKKSKLRNLCDINTAEPEGTLSFRISNSALCDDFGLMPDEVKTPQKPERFSKEFVFAWCDKINFIGNTLDYMRNPGTYPFISSHIDLILQYCLEHDKNNDFAEVKVMMACILSQYSYLSETEYKAFLNALMENENSFILINAAFQYIRTAYAKRNFLQMLFELLGFSVEGSKITAEDLKDIETSVAKQSSCLENNNITCPNELYTGNKIVSKENFEYLESMDKPELNMILRVFLDGKTINISKLEKILELNPQFIIPRAILAQPRESSSGEKMDCS
ncbi:hypothetical protein ENBRE01_1323 [Enteropsectra breve]|nr:hypothetical protein ENBRE01_1323 [Enteropsectra breve]